jgi:hypothetical protein
MEMLSELLKEGSYAIEILKAHAGFPSSVLKLKCLMAVCGGEIYTSDLQRIARENGIDYCSSDRTKDWARKLKKDGIDLEPRKKERENYYVFSRPLEGRRLVMTNGDLCRKIMKTYFHFSSSNKSIS